jgi:hypothetical protein
MEGRRPPKEEDLRRLKRDDRRQGGEQGAGVPGGTFNAHATMDADVFERLCGRGEWERGGVGRGTTGAFFWSGIWERKGYAPCWRGIVMES